MDIGAPLIAHAQATEVSEPGQGALDDPAVATQALAGVDALAGDAHPDVAFRQGLTAARDVIGLVGMEFVRPLASLTRRRLDGRDGVDQVLEDDRVVAIGTTQERGQRDPGSLDHKMALRARFAPIRRIRPREVAPLLAGILALSSDTRLQSIWPASPRRSSSVWCSRPQTPASCQS